MIPQIGLTELLLVGALALIVVGPKDLPLMMRRVGRMVGQAKNLAREFQSSFDELGRQAELDELKKEVESLKKEATGDLDRELSRTNREIGEAVSDRPKPYSSSRPLPDPEDPGLPVEPARKPGPRIEPVAQPTPAPQDRPTAAPKPDITPAEPARADQD